MYHYGKCSYEPIGSTMIQFNDIMHRIKTIIAANIENRRVYNKEVAQVLELTPEYFAVIKKRGNHSEPPPNRQISFTL